MTTSTSPSACLGVTAVMAKVALSNLTSVAGVPSKVTDFTSEKPVLAMMTFVPPAVGPEGGVMAGVPPPVPVPRSPTDCDSCGLASLPGPGLEEGVGDVGQ